MQQCRVLQVISHILNIHTETEKKKKNNILRDLPSIAIFCIKYILGFGGKKMKEQL